MADLSLEEAAERPANAVDLQAGMEPCGLCTAFRITTQNGNGFCAAKSPQALFMGYMAAALEGQHPKPNIGSYWPNTTATTRRCRDDFKRDPIRWIVHKPKDPTTTETGQA